MRRPDLPESPGRGASSPSPPRRQSDSPWQATELSGSSPSSHSPPSFFPEYAHRDSFESGYRSSIDINRRMEVSTTLVGPRASLPCSNTATAQMRDSPTFSPALEEPRAHAFVKTTFSKAIKCRLCNEDTKRHAVLCSQCGLVAHARCIEFAPTCDFRSLLNYSNGAGARSPLGRVTSRATTAKESTGGGFSLSDILSKARRVSGSASGMSRITPNSSAVDLPSGGFMSATSFLHTTPIPPTSPASSPSKAAGFARHLSGLVMGRKTSRERTFNPSSSQLTLNRTPPSSLSRTAEADGVTSRDGGDGGSSGMMSGFMRRELSQASGTASSTSGGGTGTSVSASSPPTSHSDGAGRSRSTTRLGRKLSTIDTRSGTKLSRASNSNMVSPSSPGLPTATGFGLGLGLPPPPAARRKEHGRSLSALVGGRSSSRSGYAGGRRASEGELGNGLALDKKDKEGCTVQ